MERIRLMVVEDNTELRKMLTDYFSAKDDVEIVGVATNGVEALSQIDNLEPDVMLLDMIMPQMDGFETLSRMRGRVYAKKPEVIALTALCRDDFITRAIDLGARYYMVKPFDFDLLYKRVQEAGTYSRETSVVMSIPTAINQKTLDELTANMFLTIGHSGAYQGLSVPAHGRTAGGRIAGNDQPDHQGAVSDHRAAVQYVFEQGGARHPARDRGSLGARTHRRAQSGVRQERLHACGKADERRIHRAGRR